MIVIRNYHKNSWKLHDCHKRTASLKNGTIVCFWMERVGHIGHIGRMVMGQGDYGVVSSIETYGTYGAYGTYGTKQTTVP